MSAEPAPAWSWANFAGTTRPVSWNSPSIGPRGIPANPTSSNLTGARVDPRRRPWYIEAKQKRKQIWSDTYMLVDSRGEPDMPGISCATPILAEDGSLVGVVGASFDVIKLSNYLSTLKVGSSGNGFAFVIEFRDDGTRRVIAHKNNDILLRPIRNPQTGEREKAHQPTRELVPIDELADRRVPAFVDQARFSEKYTPSRLEGTRRVEFDFKGVRYFGAYCCLSTSVTPDWLICIVMPENDVLARVYRGQPVDVLDRGGHPLRGDLDGPLHLHASGPTARADGPRDRGYRADRTERHPWHTRSSAR